MGFKLFDYKKYFIQMLAVGMAATGGGGAVFDVFSSQPDKIFQTTKTHKHTTKQRRVDFG